MFTLRLALTVRRLIVGGAPLLVSVIMAMSHASAQTFATLYTFTGGSDGGNPPAGLVTGPNGAFYGTTEFGGNLGCSQGCGTVFRLTAPAVPGDPWTDTVLYSFSGQNGDGQYPLAGLVIGKDGSLYGTTNNGGGNYCSPHGCGTVFKLAPPPVPGGAWTETVLHEFTAQDGDGAYPQASMVFGPNGALFGTTTGGGTGCGTSGCGTVFELTPPAVGGGPWNETLIHSFTGQDGAVPMGLVLARLSHLEGAAGAKPFRISEGYPRVFTTRKGVGDLF